MTGAKIKVELDDARAQAALQRIATGATNAVGLFSEIGSTLEDTTRARFRTKTAPDGTPWLNLSPRTLKKKRGPGILVERGDLLNSITFDAGAAYVDILAGPTEYAAIHQWGGKTGRGGKVNIPARPYLGLSDEDQAEITEAAVMWLDKLAGP